MAKNVKKLTSEEELEFNQYLRDSSSFGSKTRNFINATVGDETSEENETTATSMAGDANVATEQDAADVTSETIEQDDKQTEQADIPTDRSVRLPSTKRQSGKQVRYALDEYRTNFLQVPRIHNRKTVFISGDLRDSLDEVVRRLGGRGMSVSGFIENMARQHLKSFDEDYQQWLWRKF
ncbi:DUF3408 domain-containing protein [Bacteroides helcogenes]|uniref:DUF3408 domain-containing protein n=1 Tax=Bacteroides helcogenes (strain ATCC 35417 / DSM 20613 / JCM 6297 / CCUG 15421 / P 36-108) TaxID=693979 RepID=E6SRL6_BACT6|nr:DUF3408 domain-containing protein [Bacteroides helcogenes]ADV45106.1 hypothetical protein Bache_3182 [Bacteroides helcogenes P 36-108]MDY5238666.1 DUF3408 domain-containing protein [Bacteroides helcogenes]